MPNWGNEYKIVNQFLENSQLDDNVLVILLQG